MIGELRALPFPFCPPDVTTPLPQSQKRDVILNMWLSTPWYQNVFIAVWHTLSAHLVSPGFTPPPRSNTCLIAAFSQQEAGEKFWSIIRQDLSPKTSPNLLVMRFFLLLPDLMCLLVCTALSWFDPCWPHLHHGAGYSPGRSPSLLRSNRRKSCCRWVSRRHFCKHCWTRWERSLPAAFQEPAGELQQQRVRLNFCQNTLVHVPPEIF